MVAIRKIALADDDHLETVLSPPAVVLTQLVVKKCFEDLQLGWSQFSCDTGYNSTTLDCRTTLLCSSTVQVDSGAAMLYELLRKLILLDRHDPYMAYC